MIAGPTFSTRLWCVIELYTFIKMGGTHERIIVKALQGQGDVAASFASFDVRKAQCYLRSDRDRLLSVVELGFGTLTPFNDVIRGLLVNRARASTQDTVVTA